jgi:hypothetical protein
MDLLISVSEASQTFERAQANSHRSILEIDILLERYRCNGMCWRWWDGIMLHEAE